MMFILMKKGFDFIKEIYGVWIFDVYEDELNILEFIDIFDLIIYNMYNEYMFFEVDYKDKIKFIGIEEVKDRKIKIIKGVVNILELK